MASSSDNGGIPRRKAVPLGDCFQLVAPSSSFKSWRAGPGSTPGPSQQPAPPPPRRQAPAAAPAPEPAPAPTSAPAPSRPADPMDTSEDYDGFGRLGSAQAAFVYQQIVYPAVCRSFGPPPHSEVPAWAFFPAPFVVPAAYQQQPAPSAAVVGFTTNFFASARAAAASSSSTTTTTKATSSSSYRARY
ncbi:hypothetical protein EG329_003961 [Mollisiaceae sp. DMI_Dod_QoI]|nr:hypothetical protein EG329_003961 [Helotiales sp. DMI_Dod_QoI]